LYVDDEPDIRELVTIALQFDDDLDVRTCCSGAEALDLVSEFHPHIVLLDVMMPDLDGPTTLSHLRRIPGCADIPVVFFTAKVLPGEVERFRRLGAAAVLPKPFDPLTLAQQVREMLDARGAS
jgi:CheY-like chemotaxis protein